MDTTEKKLWRTMEQLTYLIEDHKDPETPITDKQIEESVKRIVEVIWN